MRQCVGRIKRSKVVFTHIEAKLGHLPVNAESRSLVKSVLQDMYITVTDLAGKMRGYCEEIFENALDDRLIDTNPVPPAKNFTLPNRKTKHHGTIEGVERVQSTREWMQPELTESEKLVDANFQQLKAWKAEFEKSNGRPPSKADILLADKEILNLARRLGDLG